jgi:hypothetical protein
MFGIFRSAPHDECKPGNGEGWALDPHFDDWIDCSRWSDELRLVPSIDDSMSGLDIQLGSQDDTSSRYAFSGFAVYSGGNSVVARNSDDSARSSDEVGCALTLVFAGKMVELHAASQCFNTTSGDQRQQMLSATRFLSAETEPSPPENVYELANKEFDSNGRRVHVWIFAPAYISVAWTLGLNRSLQVASFCDGLSGYDDLVDFFARYRTAIISRDADTLAKLTAFPLQIDTAGKELIKNSRQLKDNLQTVFPHILTSVVRDLDPHFVYCAHGHVMVAAGRIWAKPDESGDLRVYFVDSHAKPRATPKAITPN